MLHLESNVFGVFRRHRYLSGRASIFNAIYSVSHIASRKTLHVQSSTYIAFDFCTVKWYLHTYFLGQFFAFQILVSCSLHCNVYGCLRSSVFIAVFSHASGPLHLGCPLVVFSLFFLSRQQAFSPNITRGRLSNLPATHAVRLTGMYSSVVLFVLHV